MENPILFTYLIEANVTYLVDNEPVSFTVQKEMSATVEREHYDYLHGTIVSSNTVQIEMATLISDYLTQESILIDDVTDTTYNVSTEEQTVGVYFNPELPETQTTDGTLMVYGYQVFSLNTDHLPHNLIASSTENSITLSWEYDDYGVEGFRIYNDLGSLLATISPSARSWRARHLNPDTNYTYLISAFNHVGESGAESITQTTEAKEWLLEDYHYQPIDQEDSEPIPIFQSGVGDHADLSVKTFGEEVSYERFRYTAQIKGYSYEQINIYPQRYFQYRFRVEDEETIQSSWFEGAIDGDGPFRFDNDGQTKLRVPLEIQAGDLTDPQFYVEINDQDNNHINYRFEKQGDSVTTSYNDDYVIFYSNESSRIQQSVEKAWYGPKIQSEQVHVIQQDDTFSVRQNMPSPLYDPSLSEAERNNIDEWEILLSTDNANVGMRLDIKPANFLSQNNYIRPTISAYIINPKQTSWHPHIHNGYYYLHQSERYLFAESDPRSSEIITEPGFLPLPFTYSIRLDAKRRYDGGLNSWTDQYPGDFTGTFNQTTLDRYQGSLALIDGQTLGTYISEPKTFTNTAEYYDPVEWSAIVPAGTIMTVYLSVLVDDVWTSWTEINQNETPSVPLSDQIRYQIDFNGTVDDSPQLEWIKISGAYQDVYLDESYSLSEVGLIPSDGDPHLVSEQKIKDMMNDYLIERYVSQVNLSNYTYTIQTSEVGLTISSQDKESPGTIYINEEIGEGHIFAESVAIQEQDLRHDLKIIVDPNNRTRVKPVPQQGSPIIVHDHSNDIPQQVHFWTSDGKPTLTYTDEIETNGRRDLNLVHLNIDPNTLEVQLYDEISETWNIITDYDLVDNRLVFNVIYPLGRKLKVSYRIKHSFYVDYNYNPEKDQAELVFHDPVLVGSERKITVMYETNKETPYYIANEISLNPIKNSQNQGFIYLTDRVETATKLHLYASPSTMFATGYDQTTIHAQLLDQYNNPVTGQNLVITASAGNITSQNLVTDNNGSINTSFTAPEVGGEVTIEIIDEATGLSDTATIQVIELSLVVRMNFELTSLSIDEEDILLLTAYVVGEDQEPILEETVTFTTSAGTFVSDNVLTNYYGQAIARLDISNVTDEMIQVYAYLPAFDLTETVNIHISGVSNNV